MLIFRKILFRKILIMPGHNKKGACRHVPIQAHLQGDEWVQQTSPIPENALSCFGGRNAFWGLMGCEWGDEAPCGPHGHSAPFQQRSLFHVSRCLWEDLGVTGVACLVEGSRTGRQRAQKGRRRRKLSRGGRSRETVSSFTGCRPSA